MVESETQMAGITPEARNDDETLYDVAHAKYSSELHAVVIGWMRSEDAAKDVKQDIYQALLKIKSTLTANPQAYIFTVARRKCLDHLNANKRFVVDSGTVAELIDRDTNVFYSEPAEAVCSTNFLQSFFSRLPLTQQIAVLLHFREGLTYAQIAEKMRRSDRSVERYIHKARNTLRKMLKTQAGEGPGGRHD